MKHLFLIGVILSSLVNIGNENIVIDKITRSENDKFYASSANSKIDITLTKYNFYSNESLDISFNYVANNLVVESEKACDIELTYTNYDYNLKLNSFSLKGENIINIIEEDECIGKIYTYSDGNLNYLSLYSCDDAKEKYFYENLSTLEDKYLLDYLETPEDYEFNETYYDAMRKYETFMYDDSFQEVSRKIESVNNDKIKIKGNLYWYDSSNNQHPVEEILVSLQKNHGGFYSNTLTDENGYYEIEIDYNDYVSNNFPNLYLMVETCTLGSYVKRCLGDEYIFTSNLYKDISNNETITNNFYFYPGKSDRTSALEISQALLIPRAYVLEMDNTNMPAINVCYPNIYTDGCYYSSILNHIAIKQSDYKYWDPITHEYGHYINDYFGLCEKSKGGSHYVTEDLIKKHGHRNGMILAMSEGLATYLGIASQLFYKNKFVVPTFGDMKYTDMSQYFERNYDFSEYCYGTSDIGGEGNEFSIPSLLLKLMDDIARKDDNVSIGHQNLWNILKRKKHENILSLVVDIINVNDEFKEGISLILEKEQFSFSLNKYNGPISLDNNADCWTVEWYNNTDRVGKSNVFDLVFETNSEEFIIKNITSTKYKLSEDEINTLLCFKEDVIKYYVVGYNENISLNNGYSSTSGYFNKAVYEQTYFNSSNEFSIKNGSSKWFKFIAPYDSKYIFEVDNDSDIQVEFFNSLKLNNCNSDEKTYIKSSNNKLFYEIELKKEEDLFIRVNNNTNSIKSINTTIYNKHEHSYNNKYLQYNKNKHYAYCKCGAKTLLSHTVIVDSGNNRTCIYCNADLSSGGTGIVIPEF